MGWFLFASLCFPVYSNDSWVSVSILPTRLQVPWGQGLSPTPLHYPLLLAVCLPYIWCSINIYGLINEFDFMKTRGEMSCTHPTVSGVGEPAEKPEGFYRVWLDPTVLESYLAISCQVENAHQSLHSGDTVSCMGIRMFMAVLYGITKR